MDTLKQWRKDMEDLGAAMAQAAAWHSKAADIILRMAHAAEPSASPDPSTPEPPDSVRKTDPAPTMAESRDVLITVCKECRKASCWYGLFMCDNARDADTTKVARSVLLAERRENADYLSDAMHEKVCGSPPENVNDDAPAPPHVHEVGSCSCDGHETGPHFPAPATRDPNTAYSDMVPKPPAPPCCVLITAGAHTGKTGTVIAAKRGKRLRVHIANTGISDDVFAANVTLLEGSSPLPVYVPKAKAAT